MTRQEVKKRIEQLRKEIEHHAYAYHVLDKPEISDAAWDSLKHELALIEAQFPEFITPDSPTQRVSGKPLPEFKKVTHKVRQWSLNDAFSEAELKTWEERNVKILQKHYPSLKTNDIDYVCELKIDGLHIVLTYQKGLLATGATRGDGLLGEDVTQNVKTIGSVPLRLNEPVDLVVEGEAWMSKEEFKLLNQQNKKEGKSLFANPRNATAGSIRQLDPRIASGRKLKSFIYDLVWPQNAIQKTQREELERLQKLGFKVEKHFAYCKNLNEVKLFLKEWEKKHSDMPYLVDGVVVKVNSIEYQNALGHTGKAPRFAIAYKFAPEEATTIIEAIDIQVGRLGRLTPVARFKPVQVAGTTVSRATLHNQAMIDKLDVRVGDTVIIRKAGDIIPEVVKVLPRLRRKDARKFLMPKACGECGSLVKVANEGESVLHYCTNKLCGRQREARIIHFVSKRALNIDGLGDKIVRRFMDIGFIKDASDIFVMKEGDISSIPGFGEKSAENIITSIDKSKRAPLAKFIYALGIPQIGERASQSLAEFIVEKTGGRVKREDFWHALSCASLKDLQTIPDFGPKAAESIKQWFNDKKNLELLERLIKRGVMVEFPKKPRYSQLVSKSFLFTGSLPNLTRDEAKDMVIGSGGIVQSDVSKTTDYVVAGDKPGSKYERAKRLGVKIIDEMEFLRLVRKEEVG